ncbi:uncharacterized protein GIQ15_01321 [Arthroderma uncinatum]|uniref:uncharacterized protein n=1 Tax=Arthroderma uncinatum TaxID=74035 RepID=UPI00144A93C7|nr:uncharacterized protein GIQ15_01321 [Arthroderma uncinatum]KAF3491804.1 hypothetical protein GIQ15_01321 [Arthroderma uncinatum]
MQSSEVKAISHVIASFFALGQTIHTLPKQAPAKSALWIFSLVSLGPYLANIFAINSAKSSQIIHYRRHPVEILMRSDRSDFEDLLERQSKNYTAAHDEYQRRYNIEPPPGFKAWYEFAKLHESPIIDEFDMIFDAIAPFWRLSGKEVLEVMGRARNTPDSELWLCTFYGTQAKSQCHHPTRAFDRHIQLLFDTLLKDLPGVIPDVKFLVNHLDEPRVIIPPPSAEGVSHGSIELNLTNLSRQNVGVETYGLPFVTNRSDHMDPCNHFEYSSTNGLFMSPTSFRLFEGLVPILSTGSPQMMGDILYPSAAYIESEFQYDDARDVEWDKKRNNLYWAGSTTGAFVANDDWYRYHRQRFVTLAQNLETRGHYYIRENGDVLHSIKSSFLNSRLYDVAFTKIFQCETKYCREQRAYFPRKPWADKDKAFRSQLVFDIDGNAISGRYYKLLASKSAPLKQTLLREWHDERLMPWVHYIPVSQSMGELPEKTRRLPVAVALVVVIWSVTEVLWVQRALVRQLNTEPVNAIGRDNVFVSLQESGSWDDSKDQLRHLDALLAENDVPRRIILDDTTHLDEISKPPVSSGWIKAPSGQTELRRIPYLAKLRNSVMEPLYERKKEGIVYDKVLFLNDVVFNTLDIRRLLSTRAGNYAAACSLDFSKPPNFYDTFALRDSEGHDQLMQTWPYFRSRTSRHALKNSQPIPVKSCWNGVVAMDSAPFYQNPPLKFRGISDSLAKLHLEGSECCLIHADNPLSKNKGVWLNPNVRVGYSTPAYTAVNPEKKLWLSTLAIAGGLWENRLLRWITTSWFTEHTVRGRLFQHQAQVPGNTETGSFCLINEMQVLVANGWAHR